MPLVDPAQWSLSSADNVCEHLTAVQPGYSASSAGWNGGKHVQCNWVYDYLFINFINCVLIATQFNLRIYN